MSKSFSKRLGEAIEDYLSPAKKAQAVVGKLVQALVFLGFAGVGVALARWPTKMLPPSTEGKLLLSVTILGLAALGVTTAFRLRSEMGSSERVTRNAARKRAWTALTKILGDMLLLAGSPFNEERVREIRKELDLSVREYGVAGSETHPLEAMTHMFLYRRLRTALEHRTSINLVLDLGTAMEDAFQLYAKQSPLFEDLDRDEREVLAQSTIHVVRVTLNDLEQTKQSLAASGASASPG